MERYKTLNVFDFTVKREKPKVGISIVGKRLCHEKINAGIYVGTIHESGDIAKDGRIGKTVQLSFHLLNLSKLIFQIQEI